MHPSLALSDPALNSTYSKAMTNQPNYNSQPSNKNKEPPTLLINNQSPQPKQDLDTFFSPMLVVNSKSPSKKRLTESNVKSPILPNLNSKTQILPNKLQSAVKHP